MDDLYRAVFQRCSRRNYSDIPLTPEDVEALRALIVELCGNGDRRIRLVLNDGEAFNGFRKSYGVFSGVQNYIALIGNKPDMVEIEKLGYYGEWLVLKATALGFGTCWVCGTFDRASCNLDLTNSERIIGVITIGYVPSKWGGREKLIYSTVRRNTKTLEELYTSDFAAPNWFLAGIKAVQRAPSAANRQPVIFSYTDGVVTAAIEKMSGEYNALDLGIAKLHFEIGAGGGEWEFGNGAKFTRKKPAYYY